MKNLKEFGFPVDQFDQLLREEKWEELLDMVTFHYNRVKHNFTLSERVIASYRLGNIRFCIWVLRRMQRINQARRDG